MISVRNGMFETNSSSCHCLILSKTAETELPTTIELDSDDGTGDFVRAYVRGLNEAASKQLVNWLYLNGVKTIIYNGSNKYINKFIEEFKDNPVDLGVPELDDEATAGTLINFLTGCWEEYIGMDSGLEYEEDETTYWL